MTLEAEKFYIIHDDGHEYVYLYYYPSYRELAMMNEVHVWPCKIGRTEVNPIIRVTQQLNSCAPEMPVLALVFQCRDSKILESTIHNFMKLHSRHINNPFNKEWFNTNHDEVLSIVTKLVESF